MRIKHRLHASAIMLFMLFSWDYLLFSLLDLLGWNMPSLVASAWLTLLQSKHHLVLFRKLTFLLTVFLSDSFGPSRDHESVCSCDELLNFHPPWNPLCPPTWLSGAHISIQHVTSTHAMFCGLHLQVFLPTSIGGRHWNSPLWMSSIPSKC